MIQAVRWGCVVSLILSCGYRFTAGNSPFPEGIKTVGVVVLKNGSSDPGLEVIFTSSLRDQLARAGRLSGGNPEAVIAGEIQSTEFTPNIRSLGSNAPNSYRLTGRAVLKLMRGGQVLSEAALVGTEDFLRRPDIHLTEAERGAALRRLADSMMREGIERLASGF
jgi:hypothetical protein